MIWTFHESGCIPGVPGTFAGCRVDLHDDGTYEVLPLLASPVEEKAVLPDEAPPVDDVPRTSTNTKKKEA